MHFLLMAVLVFLSMSACADELHLVLNGKAIHLDKGDYNEKNWGLGLNYDFTPHDNWIKFLHTSYFKDSNDNTSKCAGGGIKRRFNRDDDSDGWFYEGGVIGFLMTRKDYKNNSPFPGVLPFAAVGNGPVRLNMTYIPAVTPKYKKLLYFQLMVRVKGFD